MNPLNDTKFGRWSKAEHNKFLDAVNLWGKNWVKVAEFVGTRNSIQVRSHAQKFYLSQYPDSYEMTSSFREDKSTQYGEGVVFYSSESD